LIAGCAQRPFSGFAARFPFRSTSQDVDGLHNALPATQMQELAALAQRAPTMSPAERQQVASQLSGRLETERDPLLRRQMVAVLGSWSTPEAAAGLQRALSDEDPDVRQAACRAWQRHGGPQAIEALAGVIANDGDVDVRLAAVSAIESFRDPSAMRALSVALDDADPALQYRAVQVLRSVTGQDYGSDLQAWRQLAQGGMPPQTKEVSFARRLTDWFR
jgi:HEAT repeat protein